MPESSLTEEAAITPGGNVPAASTAHMRVDDNSVLSSRADIHPLMELLAERDTPVLIHGGQSIFVLPETAGRAREAPHEEP